MSIRHYPRGLTLTLGSSCVAQPPAPPFLKSQQPRASGHPWAALVLLALRLSKTTGQAAHGGAPPHHSQAGSTQSGAAVVGQGEASAATWAFNGAGPAHEEIPKEEVKSKPEQATGKLWAQMVFFVGKAVCA